MSGYVFCEVFVNDAVDVAKTLLLDRLLTLVLRRPGRVVDHGLKIGVPRVPADDDVPLQLVALLECLHAAGRRARVEFIFSLTIVPPDS